MKGRWEVLRASAKVYRVARKLDADKPAGEGNQEYAGSPRDDRRACEALARYLNEKEGTP